MVTHALSLLHVDWSDGSAARWKKKTRSVSVLALCFFSNEKYTPVHVQQHVQHEENRGKGGAKKERYWGSVEKRARAAMV
jgi:hypothetical protein